MENGSKNLEYEIGDPELSVKTTPNTSLAEILSRHKEDVRKYLAFSLVGIFAIEIMFSCLAAFYGASSESLRTVLQIIISPTVALAGSAMGYYFGSSSK